MANKAWRHPIKYLRLVTTPTCDTCCHFIRAGLFSNDRCACEKYLEHVNRLEGVRYDRAEIRLVRGTRWCDYEPIEDGDTDD